MLTHYWLSLLNRFLNLCITIFPIFISVLTFVHTVSAFLPWVISTAWKNRNKDLSVTSSNSLSDYSRTQPVRKLNYQSWYENNLGGVCIVTQTSFVWRPWNISSDSRAISIQFWAAGPHLSNVLQIFWSSIKIFPFDCVSIAIFWEVSIFRDWGRLDEESRRILWAQEMNESC